MAKTTKVDGAHVRDKVADDGQWESLSDRIRRTRQIQDKTKSPIEGKFDYLLCFLLFIFIT